MSLSIGANKRIEQDVSIIVRSSSIWGNIFQASEIIVCQIAYLHQNNEYESTNRIKTRAGLDTTKELYQTVDCSWNLWYTVRSWETKSMSERNRESATNRKWVLSKMEKLDMTNISKVTMSSLWIIGRVPVKVLWLKSLVKSIKIALGWRTKGKIDGHSMA